MCLISSNPFGIAGANTAGLQAAWIDRSGSLFDILSPRPGIVVSSLTALTDALA
ncbi:MAG TPA: hypothetical protein VKV40_17615 [Ktedonobacteraceae bacterium]|nr:hypothetical protein [Ktedonobacteraceae bacterium]